MAGYSKMAWPQIEQLKKNNFGWNDEAEEAFQKLKSATVTVHVLALPDFSAPFVVETDESGHGLEAVLMQWQQPLAYYNHVFSARARHKLIYEQELMAIVFVLQKWRPYLVGRKFFVRTYQKSLKFLLEQRLVAIEHQKWVTKLLGSDFEVDYRPRIENKVVGALSHIPEEVNLAVLSIPQANTMDEVQQEVRADETLHKIISDLELD